jgi:hypothetical protein
MLYAVITLLIAGAYAVVSFSAVPEDGALFWYWPVAFYNASAWSLTAACSLGLLAVVMVWALWLFSKAPNRVGATLAAALALAAGALMCWASLPVGIATYRHIDSATLAGRTYQLGVRFAQNGDSYYMVSECDEIGFACRAHYLRDAGRPEFAALPTLAADPNQNALLVRVGEQTIATYHP